MQTDQQLRKLGIDSTRKANLLKLRDYLRTVPQEKFFMGTFFAIVNEGQDLYDYESHLTLFEPYLWEIDPVEEVHVCGTVACAIGQGPAAGIPVGHADSWQVYSQQNLVDNDAPEGDRAEDFLFSPDWQFMDKTPMGVVKRIDILLETGLECWPSDEIKYFDHGNLPY